jgi:hypothetical protein
MDHYLLAVGATPSLGYDLDYPAHELDIGEISQWTSTSPGTLHCQLFQPVEAVRGVEQEYAS